MCFTSDVWEKHVTPEKTKNKTAILLWLGRIFCLSQQITYITLGGPKRAVSAAQMTPETGAEEEEKLASELG